MATSRLLISALPAIKRSVATGPVLDLACGGGRNGIHLVNENVPVVFADRQEDKLGEIRAQFGENELAAFWAVDFEESAGNPLAGLAFSSIVVFRYLHRPLMRAIKHAIHPGGLVVYETYTVDQPRFGRPTNPDFLLRPGELQKTFSNWETVYSFEGVALCETSGREQAIAQIVARKPTDSHTGQHAH